MTKDVGMSQMAILGLTKLSLVMYKRLDWDMTKLMVVTCAASDVVSTWVYVYTTS